MLPATRDAYDPMEQSLPTAAAFQGRALRRLPAGPVVWNIRFITINAAKQHH